MIQNLLTHRHNPDQKDHVASEQKEDWNFVDPLDVEAHLGRRHERAPRRQSRGDALTVMPGPGKVPADLKTIQRKYLKQVF